MQHIQSLTDAIELVYKLRVQLAASNPAAWTFMNHVSNHLAAQQVEAFKAYFVEEN